jgi:outer membrane protein assembly factor BamB
MTKMNLPRVRIACAVVAMCAGVVAWSCSPPVGALSSGYTWPQFHGNPGLSGTSADPSISSSNASTLGVKWMAQVGATEGSPVEAWNASLGEPLAYVGDENGYVNAVNARTGSIVWSVPFGSAFTATPLVSGSSVWVAPLASGRIYKLDAATGTIQCAVKEVGSIQGSPVVATLPGGQTLVYFPTLDTGGADGGIDAINTYSCATVFAWNGSAAFSTHAGIWSPISYGVDADGVPLVLFGSADPDSSEYAINAATGSLVWRYYTNNPPGEDWDIGAGSTISAPGVNGFADGVAYFDGKDGVFYALDLTTGALIWSWDFGNGTNTDALSTPALDGSTVVFGDNGGVSALDAVNGSLLWQYSTGGDTVNSSSAIVGPPGQQVVAFGTLGGVVHVVSLATGASLYSYQTGSFISASPADFEGTLLIDSADGFLYDFGLGGGNGAAPTTAVTVPANGSTIAYPSGELSISGTAMAPDGVGAVSVELQEDGTSGPWYQAATNSFTPGLSATDATMASPGATSTTWSLTVPVPEQGASYLVDAAAVDEDGIADISSASGKATAAASSFTMSASPSAPVVTPAGQWVPPGSPLTVSASGFQGGEHVTFTLPVNGGGTEVLGTATATASGSAGPVTGTVPSNEPFGPRTITATGGSGRAGAAAVTISNSSPQLGYGPQRLGFEENDGAISKHQAVGASYFSQAWAVTAGAAITSQPAVVDGVAYFGDSGGVFHAVTVSDAKSSWTDSIGSGITSSPAVDGGSVFVGDQAGTVLALSNATGASEWSRSLGSGIMSSPAVSGGFVFVASSAGMLDALDETTGAVVWSDSLGAATDDSPSVDPAKDVLVIGDQSGVLHGVSTSNGQVLWTHATNGQPIVAPATFDDGLVLVGSENDAFYAVNEASGKVTWARATGGPITSSAVATGGSDVGVGSGDGDVYNFLIPSGKLDSTQPVGSPIDGLTGTKGIYIVATSAGLSLLRGSGGTRVDWHYAKPNTFVAPVVILNGEVFAAGSDGVLRAFVIPGNDVS